MFCIVAFLSVITRAHCIRHFEIARETKSVLPRIWIWGCFGNMEFPAFEWIRISRKWNISAAREQWGLGRFQLKCSKDNMECYKRDAYHVGRLPWPAPRLAHVNFYWLIDFLFIYLIHQVTDNPCSLRRMGFLEHEPWLLPRFPAEFFPTGDFFFSAGFFWPPLWQCSLLTVAQLCYTLSTTCLNVIEF